MFDKTGTLTWAGRRSPTVVAGAGLDDGAAARAGGVARGGLRAPARARRSSPAARERGSGSRAVDGFEAIAGARRRGASSRTGTAVLVGKPAAVTRAGVDLAPLAAAAAAERRRAGRRSRGRRRRGRRADRASPTRSRPESAAAVARAARGGHRGMAADRRQPGDRRRGRAPGGHPRERVVAEVLPGGQGRDRRAAPGATAAGSRWSATASTTHRRSRRRTSGVAIGTGADVAIEASDVTLVGGDPRARGLGDRAVAGDDAGSSARTCSGRSPTTCVLIPVAMGVLYPAFGITLDPAFAAGAMALSSVSVVPTRCGCAGRRPRARRRGDTCSRCPQPPAPGSRSRRTRATSPASSPIGSRSRCASRDTDAMGHVNNARYLTYCEIARVAYWEQVTGEPLAIATHGEPSEEFLAEIRVTFRARPSTARAPPSSRGSAGSGGHLHVEHRMPVSSSPDPPPSTSSPLEKRCKRLSHADFSRSHVHVSTRRLNVNQWKPSTASSGSPTWWARAS